jgi:CRISPR/Cas system Type II protein with McrA/HNH and RuvC-like nuclease domain
MNQNQKTVIPDYIQDIAYKKFCSLPLKHKLVIYGKLVHGNSFKAQNNDLFGLNRRTMNKIFKNFVESLKTSVIKRAPK